MPESTIYDIKNMKTISLTKNSFIRSPNTIFPSQSPNPPQLDIMANSNPLLALLINPDADFGMTICVQVTKIPQIKKKTIKLTGVAAKIKISAKPPAKK